MIPDARFQWSMMRGQMMLNGRSLDDMHGVADDEKVKLGSLTTAQTIEYRHRSLLRLAPISFFNQRSTVGHRASVKISGTIEPMI